MTGSISLSTSWHVSRYKSADIFAGELKAVGIDTVELNYSVNRKMIRALMPFFENGDIKVSSLHNFCPRPDVENSLRPHLVLSSQNEEFRKLAVAYTRETIDMAVFLGTKAVVLHIGEVSPARVPEGELRALFAAGNAGTRNYDMKRKELTELRKKTRQPYVEACEKSILE